MIKLSFEHIGQHVMRTYRWIKNGYGFLVLHTNIKSHTVALMTGSMNNSCDKCVGHHEPDA